MDVTCAAWHPAVMHSNGNSFSSGQSVNAGPARPAEPWIIRLLGPVQDRGGI